MTNRFCHCKRCKRIRKTEGKVLGSRRMGFWFGPGDYYFGMVSDYIPHHKFSKGRRPTEKFDSRNVDAT